MSLLGLRSYAFITKLERFTRGHYKFAIIWQKKKLTSMFRLFTTSRALIVQLDILANPGEISKPENKNMKPGFHMILKESATSGITVGIYLLYLHRKIADGCRHNRHVFPFIYKCFNDRRYSAFKFLGANYANNMAAVNRRWLLSCQLALLVSYMNLRRRKYKRKRNHKFWVRDIFMQRRFHGQFRTLFQELHDLS